MRRALAIAVFASLASSGYAQAPSTGVAWFAFIDEQGQRRNVRLIFPDGVELRAERMVLTSAVTGTTTVVEAMADDLRVMGSRPGAPPREYILAGEVKLIFPAR